MNNRRGYHVSRIEDGTARKHHPEDQEEKPFKPIIRCNYETGEAYSVLSEVIANGGKLSEDIQHPAKTVAGRTRKRSGPKAVQPEPEDSGVSVSGTPEDRAEDLREMVKPVEMTIQIDISGQRVSLSWGELRSLYEDLRKVFGGKQEVAENEQF